MLGAKLDAFRKARLEEHKSLTITKLYNVLDMLRNGQELDDKSRSINEAGLVSSLKQIHDELDVAVSKAYRWSYDNSDSQILEKLVALNTERFVQELDGIVQWIRPEFQAPKQATKKAQQVEAMFGTTEAVTGKPTFPKGPGEQVAAVRVMLATEGKPIRAGELARRFKQGKRIEERVGDLLQILAAIGQAQTENGSKYFAVR